MSEYSMPSYFQSMPVIGKDLSAFHEDNAAEIQAVEQEIHEIREAALEAGKSTEALNESGQWTAMQRIMELVDEGTWCPLNSLYNPQDNKNGSVGIVKGLGRIDGKWGAIIARGFGYAIKTAISQGAKRGLFSNEAGMGSTPHAHALANVDCPHDQGVVAMIGVFIDTFVVLTLNALVIISTLYTADGPLASGYVGDITGVLGKANLAQTAFGVVFGESAGNMFVAVCLFFFAFSTILSWNLFGKINVSYLFGKKSTVVYTVLALVFIFLGTMMSNDLVWELSDMFNNLMVIPNAVALFALTSLVVKHADDPNRIPGKK